MKSIFSRILISALLIATLFTVLAPIMSCGGKEATPDANTPVITWKSDGLFALVPPPTKAYGKMLTEKTDLIEFETRYTQKSDFSLYVQLCAEKGFTNSVVNTEFFYSAVDNAGYKISVQFNEARMTMSVTFDATNIKVTAPKSSEYFVGLNKDGVTEILSDAGFSNIIFKPIEILESSDIADGTVESVLINALPFEEGAELHKSDSVVIRYYMRRIGFYWTQQEFIGKHYSDVEKVLRQAGFVNVTCKENVIPIDYSSDERVHEQVYELTVDGVTEQFWYGSMYLPDSAIIINYYSYGVKGDFIGRDDKLSLYNYLGELANVDLSKYHAKNVERFRDAYDNATAVLNDETSTELEVKAAMQSLKSTYGNLAKFKTWQKVLLYIGIGVGVVLLIGWASCFDEWSYEAYPWVMLGIGVILALTCLLILIL